MVINKYMKYAASSKAASGKAKTPSRSSKVVKATAPTKIGSSALINCHEVLKYGVISAARPRTSAILAILDPMTLAGTTSVAPRQTATIAEDNSGIVVPKLTIVTPITNGGRRQ